MVHHHHHNQQSAQIAASSDNPQPQQTSAHDLFEQFEIVFNKGDKPVFLGDEPIFGHLKIKLKNDTFLNAIHLQFKGEAKWIGSGRKEDKEGQTEKIYFDKNFVLLERPPGHPEPGHFKFVAHFAYSLPFECPLPNGCETSYESGTAHIRYFARAILETDQREKIVTKKAFTIVASPGIDQLILPPQHEPIERKETARFGGCCCRSKIEAEIHLPKSGYAPGENIVGSFYIDSRTARYAVDHVEVRLLDGAERIQQPVADQLKNNNKKKEIGGDQSAPREKMMTNNGIPLETTATITAVDQNDGGQKSEAKKAKKQKKEKKTQKHQRQEQSANNEQVATKTTTPRGAKQAKVPLMTALCQRVVAGNKLDSKAMLTTEPDKQDGKRRRSARVGMDNVVLIRVPAVIPTIESIEPDAHDDRPLNDPAELQEEQRVLMGSPSTATIRARREPFIGVQYALQVALGTHILLEVPIKVVHPMARPGGGPYVNDDIGISFAPFACGAQPITEPDETALLHGGPSFTFTPQYPMYVRSPSPPPQAKAINETVITELAPSATELAPNGTATITVDDGVMPVLPTGAATENVVVRKTITTTIVHQPTTPVEEGMVVGEDQQQQQNLKMIPNGAKPYQQKNHKNNDEFNDHDARQQQQQQTMHEEGVVVMVSKSVVQNDGGEQDQQHQQHLSPHPQFNDHQQMVPPLGSDNGEIVHQNGIMQNGVEAEPSTLNGRLNGELERHFVDGLNDQQAAMPDDEDGTKTTTTTTTTVYHKEGTPTAERHLATTTMDDNNSGRRHNEEYTGDNDGTTSSNSRMVEDQQQHRQLHNQQPQMDVSMSG